MIASILQCSVCGQMRSAKALRGLCRHCLFKVTVLADDGETSSPQSLFAALEEDRNTLEHLGEFADYELDGQIARGGMGIVYKARQRGLNRTVAIKMIGAGPLARPEDLERFRNESEAVARLHHPNIVSIYEVGEHDGQPWFSMQYVDGSSLAEVARTNPLPPTRAATVMRQVCDAIQHAHERGILHRDIKPSNILLDHNDQPYVTDFGVAKFAQRESDVTGTDRVVGSPSYMAPEQASGHSRDVDARSDVYSLGAVLYELLTGRPPFQSDTPVQTLKLVIDAEPVSPRQLNSTIPVDLETICLKCLAKEPGRRYGAAREVRDELAAFLDQRPIRARPTSRMEALARWRRRNPGLAAALAALGLALLTGLAGTSWQWQRAEKRGAEARAQQYGLLLARASAERRSGVVGQQFATITALRQAAQMRPGERELRDEAITALALLDYKMQQHWPSYFGQYQRMSPDCQHLARANTNGVIWVLRTADDGRVAELSDSPSDRVSRLDFSADGARLRAAYASGKICLWDWRRQQVVCRMAPGSYAGRFTPVMTLDGRSLIYSDSNLKMAVLDVDSGEKRPCAIPVGGRPLAISPAGDELALGQWDSSGPVRLFRVDTGVLTHELQLPAEVIGHTAIWAPSGGWLAVDGEDLKVYIFRPERSDQPQLVLNTHDNSINSMAFHPDGSMLATSSWDGTTQFHSLTDGRRLLLLKQEGGDLVFSLDGGHFAFRGPKRQLTLGEIGWHRIARDLGGGEMPAADEGMHEVEFSTDSQWLTSAAPNGVQVFEVEHGTLQSTVSTAPARTVMLVGDRLWIQGPHGEVRHHRWTPPTNAVSIMRSPDPEWPPDLRRQAASFSPGRDCMAYTQKGHRFFQYRQEPPVELGLAWRQDHIAFNRDGTRVVVSAKGARSVWDAVAGELVATFPRTNIDTIACLNSLGSRLCSVDPEGLTCWSVSPRRVLWSAPIRSQDTFSDIQWSPSDRWIAFQLAKSRIALVSAETGTLLGYLEHPDARMIRHLAFSNDGRWLAIACAKGVTQLWDLKKLHVELAQLGLDWPE